MSPRLSSEARRAAWMIAGLFAIPVLSVSTAALVADVASTTDPAAAVVGIPATLGGVVMAGFVLRLARAARSGVVALRAVLRRFPTPDSRPDTALWQPLLGVLVAPVAQAVGPTPVGRRGPPEMRH